MPLYTIATRKLLPEDMRFEIAQTITTIHCDETGAPPEFVNVIFMTGYRMRQGASLGLNGNVRLGGNRDDELYERLHTKMHAGVANAAKLKQSRVFVKLIGVEFNWIVEGAMTMPAPGEEGDWLERKAAHHAAMGVPNIA